jgi:hypothetical protein
MLLQPADPGPRDLTPHSARVRIAYPPDPPRRRISRADMFLHACTVVLAIVVLVAIFAR